VSFGSREYLRCPLPCKADKVIQTYRTAYSLNTHFTSAVRGKLAGCAFPAGVWAGAPAVNIRLVAVFNFVVACGLRGRTSANPSSRFVTSLFQPARSKADALLYADNRCRAA
jgi:hypothetical protein